MTSFVFVACVWTTPPFGLGQPGARQGCGGPSRTSGPAPGGSGAQQTREGPPPPRQPEAPLNPHAADFQTQRGRPPRPQNKREPNGDVFLNAHILFLLSVFLCFFPHSDTVVRPCPAPAVAVFREQSRREGSSQPNRVSGRPAGNGDGTPPGFKDLSEGEENP